MCRESAVEDTRGWYKCPGRQRRACGETTRATSAHIGQMLCWVRWEGASRKFDGGIRGVVSTLDEKRHPATLAFCWEVVILSRGCESVQ